MRTIGPQNFQFNQQGLPPISVSDRLSLDLLSAGPPLNRWAPDPRNSVLATEQATTSGTEFDFTGIRASARRITVMFEDISLSVTDDILVQIGDSVGLETSGYASTGGLVLDAGATQVASSTSGFIIRLASAASNISGRMVLTLMDTANKWAASHSGSWGTDRALSGGGTKTLSDTLTQVRITRTGSDTFDSGALNILVES